MPYTLIKGSFVPSAGRPDGDSIRFRPDDASLLFALNRKGRAPKVNDSNGTVQLRFEGIDAMESAAAEPYASDATQSNLALCGAADSDNDARGYIFANQTDPYGRPISFVFSGEAAATDGSSQYLDTEQMQRSVNFLQLQSGNAYPLFYDTLYDDLRQVLAETAATARQAQRQIWPADATNSGAVYAGADSLATMPPIFPKLWRRLNSYSRSADVNRPDTLAEFPDYLASLQEERVIIFSESRTTGFDNIIAIDDAKIRMTYRPEDLVVISV